MRYIATNQIFPLVRELFRCSASVAGARPTATGTGTTSRALHPERTFPPEHPWPAAAAGQDRPLQAPAPPAGLSTRAHAPTRAPMAGCGCRVRPTVTDAGTTSRALHPSARSHPSTHGRLRPPGKTGLTRGSARPAGAADQPAHHAREQRREPCYGRPRTRPARSPPEACPAADSRRSSPGSAPASSRSAATSP